MKTYNQTHYIDLYKIIKMIQTFKTPKQPQNLINKTLKNIIDP
jgi:hypothetical protein